MAIQCAFFTTIDENQKRINRERNCDSEFLKEIQDFYRVEIVYSSNALEGYTYTIFETKILLEDGLTAGGKPMRDAYAVLGHARAYDYMFSLFNKSSISENDILFMERASARISSSFSSSPSSGETLSISCCCISSSSRRSPSPA